VNPVREESLVVVVAYGVLYFWLCKYSVPLYVIYYVRNLVSSFVLYVTRDTMYFSVIAKKKN